MSMALRPLLRRRDLACSKYSNYAAKKTIKTNTSDTAKKRQALKEEDDDDEPETPVKKRGKMNQ